mgnify:CR=1 FL=1
MNEQLQVAKVRSVNTPNRGTEGSAGIDFYVPSDFATMTVAPGESCFIPSGIKANVPSGYALIAFNKSGIALNQSLDVGACVVDSDYQGEIHLHLFNVGQKSVEIAGGDKLTQFLLVPVDHCPVTVVDENSLFEESTIRGSGGFGSTGIK